MTEAQTTLMTWNVQSGGFANYESSDSTPLREQSIRELITDTRSHYGVDSVTLPDSHRWESYYGGEEGIARHLGFNAARFALLNDERLNQSGLNDIGITFATDLPIEESRILDLDTRQGLGTIVNVDGKSLQVASVYLDDLDEEVRIRQIRALDSALETDIPTIVNGDFNLLRPRLDGAPLDVQLRDIGVRALALALPRRSELGKSIAGMNERRAYGELSTLGYTDADREAKNPTAPSRLPLFGIDYIFAKNNVSIEKPIILTSHKASDHRALVAKVTVK